MEKVLVCVLFIGLVTFPVRGKDSNKGLCEICGKSSFYPRIYNGRAAQLGEFPWRVSLINNFWLENCGGSIISKNWVLTAAHCVPTITYGQEYGVNLTLRAGTVFQFQGAQTFELNGYSYIQHRNFTSESNTHGVENDVALIKIPDPGFDFSNPNIGPVCLPYRLNKRQTGPAIASGWGFLNATTSTNYMHTVKVKLGGVEECNRLCQSKRVPFSLSETQLCLSSAETQICQGDSGGSIDVQENGRFYAYGVNSFKTDPCGDPNNVDVMTKVDAFLDWIEEKTGETFCTE